MAVAYPGPGPTLGLELLLAPALGGQATLTGAVDTIIARRTGRHPAFASRPATSQPATSRPATSRPATAVQAPARPPAPRPDGRLGRRLSAWRQRRHTRLALSALRAQQLADIGIDPADIPAIAHAVAAGTYRPPGWDVTPHQPIRNDDAPRARQHAA